MHRKKVYIRFNAIHGFRHPLRVRAGNPVDTGGLQMNLDKSNLQFVFEKLNKKHELYIFWYV